jgi:nucleoside-diphosphate-sugar epimerase
MAMSMVTVFGGTGFLGSRLVRHLNARGVTVRSAARHRETDSPRRQDGNNVIPVQADIRDPDTLAGAIEGADGVVNAVSLYVENDALTFQDIHVEGARNVAVACRGNRVQRLVHVSGIGADIRSRSPYIAVQSASRLPAKKAKSIHHEHIANIYIIYSKCQNADAACHRANNILKGTTFPNYWQKHF